MENSTNKYKLFRNYMTNELGITKEDIMNWTKEAIAEQVSKLVGQMDVHGIVSRRAREDFYKIRAELTEAIAKELVKELVITANVRS